jgi:hypothetical protein
VSLRVIIGNEFLSGVTQRSLAEENHAVKACFFYGSGESFEACLVAGCQPLPVALVPFAAIVADKETCGSAEFFDHTSDAQPPRWPRFPT